mmetsp:Transcript_36612/g.40904  ORF Transcript_36612/g.40904 Transcript_36612/m.40904 type:complete len:104 (-) Transcript_36612:207-518(-)
MLTAFLYWNTITWPVLWYWMRKTNWGLGSPGVVVLIFGVGASVAVGTTTVGAGFGASTDPSIAASIGASIGSAADAAIAVSCSTLTPKLSSPSSFQEKYADET